jgi:hypothetical protein
VGGKGADPARAGLAQPARTTDTTAAATSAAESYLGEVLTFSTQRYPKRLREARLGAARWQVGWTVLLPFLLALLYFSLAPAVRLLDRNFFKRLKD